MATRPSLGHGETVPVTTPPPLPPAPAPTPLGRLAIIGALLGGLTALGLTLTYLAQGIGRPGNFDLGGLIFLGAVLLAVGFSGLVGIFFGYYPARRASQMLPIAALRHE